MKEKAIFENLHCNTFVSDSEGEIFEGEAAFVYLHHFPFQLVTVLYQSQASLKMKQLMPDNILPFFSVSRKIPTEFLQEKYPSDLNIKSNWPFLGLWCSPGQDINPLSHN